MTEPPEWALREAKIVCAKICDYGSRGAPKEIALALAAARHRGIEESVKYHKAQVAYLRKREDTVVTAISLRTHIEAIKALSVLVSKEPT